MLTRRTALALMAATSAGVVLLPAKKAVAVVERESWDEPHTFRGIHHPGLEGTYDIVVEGRVLGMRTVWSDGLVQEQYEYRFKGRGGPFSISFSVIRNHPLSDTSVLAALFSLLQSEHHGKPTAPIWLFRTSVRDYIISHRHAHGFGARYVHTDMDELVALGKVGPVV